MMTAEPELTDEQIAEGLKIWSAASGLEMKCLAINGEQDLPAIESFVRNASSYYATALRELQWRRAAEKVTTEPPTVPGWYWWRVSPDKQWERVEVSDYRGGMHMRGDHVTSYGGYWCGPIPEPKE
jgi:hypothetical protein